MPDITQEAPEVEQHFPCDACGADMRFDPKVGQLVCEHCGSSEQLVQGPWDKSTIREMDFQKALKSDLPAPDMEETRVSKCPNCAAEVAFDPSVHATECPFCATPVVADTGVHRHIKPRAVLPFSLDEPTAHNAMNDWLGRLWFAPNGLQQYARKGRKMQGIYVPYWTYDADTKTRYTGERGTVYYVTRTVMHKGKPVQRQVAKVRWRPALGQVARFFDDVLILASRSLPKKFTDALAPWDLSQLEPYTPEYLAGFRAEGYAVLLEDGFTEARQVMDATIRRDIRFDIGGDRQRIHSVETAVRDVTFKHILLPVWVAAYKYRGESYRFVVNGSTGKVQGERPYSTVKIALAVLAGVLVAGGLGYLYAMKTMTELDTLTALLTRRHSCRAFKPDSVPQSDIETVVSAAGRAPSWCNAQPWHVVVTSGETTDRFRTALQEVATRGSGGFDLAGPEDYPGVYGERRRTCGWQLYDAVGVQKGDRSASAAQMMRNFALFDAPHVAILTSPRALGGYGAMDSGGFVLAFTLAARALGIDTIPQAAVASHSEFVRNWFDLADDRMVLCAISFGYGEENHPANSFRTGRAELSEILTWA